MILLLITFSKLFKFQGFFLSWMFYLFIFKQFPPSLHLMLNISETSCFRASLFRVWLFIDSFLPICGRLLAHIITRWHNMMFAVESFLFCPSVSLRDRQGPAKVWRFGESSQGKYSIFTLSSIFQCLLLTILQYLIISCTLSSLWCKYDIRLFVESAFPSLPIGNTWEHSN